MQRERAAREAERRRLRELERGRRLQEEEAANLARERERLRCRLNTESTAYFDSLALLLNDNFTF